MTASEEVISTIESNVATLTLNRPEARNALTRGVLATGTEALRAFAADKSVRCVVLRGAGGHFCAGADLRRTMAEDPDMLSHLDQYLDAFHGFVRAIFACPKPVIAQLEGAAVGFGADLACAADLRIASTTAYIQEKFAHIGLMPDGGGTFWLPRLVGTSRAMQMILLGDKLEAKTMVESGIAVSVVEPGALEAATRELAARVAAGPPLAFAAAKAAVLKGWGDIEAALERERDGQIRLLQSQDCIEGVMAWAQKRPPQFKGE